MPIAIRHRLITSIGLIFAVCSPGFAQPSPGSLAELERIQKTLADVAETVRPSVVAVRSTRPIEIPEFDTPSQSRPEGEPAKSPPSPGPGQTYPAVGSGMIISADGLILTNEHVVLNVEPEDITCVLSDGQTYQVRDVTTDSRRDLAVLKIDARGLQPVVFGDMEQVRQGHFVIVMGNPLGSASDNDGQPAAAFGIISALDRNLTRQLDPLIDKRYYGNLIQTDARINPGHSGGPLLNLYGQVIGINTAIATRTGRSQGVGYAIPLTGRTKQIIAHLSRGEQVDYGFLGVQLRSATEEDARPAAGLAAKSGAVVERVQPGTPVAQANLQQGDLIVAFGPDPVRDAEEFIRYVGEAEIGRSVSLTFYRDRQRHTVSVVPARRKLPNPQAFSWRGMKLAYPDWEICRSFNLPVDIAGLAVIEVKPDSAADRAGLNPGQVVQAIGDVRLSCIQKLPRITATLTGPIPLKLAGHASSAVTVP